jgi:outer membrane protein
MDMSRKFFLTLLTTLGLSAGALAAEPAPAMGIVNFATCVTDSKFGKQEQASFEALKKQMSTLLEDTEKQLNEISAKFNDSEYLDGLSPEAEEEMKVKFRTLNEDLSKYQNQYYQVLNQANMRVIQTLSVAINTAAEKVAKDKKLAMVVNKEACFFYSPKLDVTPLVIAEMDKTFDQDAKKAETGKAETASASSAKKEGQKK